MNDHIWIALLCIGSPFALIVLLLIAHLSLEIVTVHQLSMLPALRPGDRVVVFRHWPARWLHQGQIVILWPVHWDGPYGPEQTMPYIKRVVGLPGDTISLPENERNPGKTVWHIPPKHFFVLADNRPTTTDSRLWGPVPFSGLLGVVIFKLSRRNRSQDTSVL